MCKNVQKCVKNVLKCVRTCKNVQECVKMYKNVLKCARMCRKCVKKCKGKVSRSGANRSVDASRTNLFTLYRPYKIVLIVNAPGTRQMVRALDRSSKGHRFESDSGECFLSQWMLYRPMFIRANPLVDSIQLIMD